MEKDNSGDSKRKRPVPYRGMDLSAGLVFSAGFSLIASAFAGLLVGMAIDRGREGTRLAPIGFFFGLLVGLHRVYVLFRHIAERKTE